MNISIFQPTFHLREVFQEFPGDYHNTTKTSSYIEQLFENDLGEREWRRLPYIVIDKYGTIDEISMKRKNNA